MDDIAYTLLYRARNHKTGIVEDLGYISTFDNNGSSYSLTKNINEAAFKPDKSCFQRTIISEYENYRYSMAFKDEIRLVSVSGKFKEFFEPLNIIEIGDNLLEEYTDKRNDISESVKKMKVNIPNKKGESYCIKTRDDLIKLCEHYPFDNSLNVVPYDYEAYLIDSNNRNKTKYWPKIKEYRDNFFVLKYLEDGTSVKVMLPVVINIDKHNCITTNNYLSTIEIYPAKINDNKIEILEV